MGGVVRVWQSGSRVSTKKDVHPRRTCRTLPILTMNPTFIVPGALQQKPPPGSSTSYCSFLLLFCSKGRVARQS